MSHSDGNENPLDREIFKVKEISSDIAGAVSGFDMNYPWPVHLDKFGVIISQFDQLENEYNASFLKRFTVRPTDYELSEPDFIPNMLSVYTVDRMDKPKLERQREVQNVDTSSIASHNRMASDIYYMFAKAVKDHGLVTYEMVRAEQMKELKVLRSTYAYAVKRTGVSKRKTAAGATALKRGKEITKDIRIKYRFNVTRERIHLVETMATGGHYLSGFRMQRTSSIHHGSYTNRIKKYYNDTLKNEQAKYMQMLAQRTVPVPGVQYPSPAPSPAAMVVAAGAIPQQQYYQYAAPQMATPRATPVQTPPVVSATGAPAYPALPRGTTPTPAPMPSVSPTPNPYQIQQMMAAAMMAQAYGKPMYPGAQVPFPMHLLLQYQQQFAAKQAATAAAAAAAAAGTKKKSSKRKADEK